MGNFRDWTRILQFAEKLGKDNATKVVASPFGLHAGSHAWYQGSSRSIDGKGHLSTTTATPAFPGVCQPFSFFCGIPFLFVINRFIVLQSPLSMSAQTIARWNAIPLERPDPDTSGTNPMKVLFALSVAFIFAFRILPYLFPSSSSAPETMATTRVKIMSPSSQDLPLLFHRRPWKSTSTTSTSVVMKRRSLLWRQK